MKTRYQFSHVSKRKDNKLFNIFLKSLLEIFNEEDEEKYNNKIEFQIKKSDIIYFGDIVDKKEYTEKETEDGSKYFCY